jgi:uncharacterized protein (UPF0276 family)
VGLGAGFDLRWGGPIGFVTADGRRDTISPRLRTFLARQGSRLSHVFFSWQPRDRARLKLADYLPAWDDLMAALPAGLPRVLHHTALNLAALAPESRAGLFALTNALCERYHLQWINEDVGFWSLAGKPVPYPLPPILDATGLAACVRNVRECQRALAAPLVLEFPGFAAGVSLVMGKMDAYDFFRELAGETGAAVTLDVGHLLSWRWWRGWRGGALFEDLQRLPLSACFELHLSGCEIAGDRFVDAHHGDLLEEQLTLLERLLPLCPRARAVTFEDPRLEEDGELHPVSRRSLARLEEIVERWSAGAGALAPPAWPPASAVDSAGGAAPRTPRLETALASLLFDRDQRAAWVQGCPPSGLSIEEARIFESLAATELEAAAAAARAKVRDRAHRGTGRLVDLFPRCVAGWRAAHPEDLDLDELFARFLASPAIHDWREHPGAEPGICVEEAFARFAQEQGLADRATCEEELLSAVLRALTVSPEPGFLPPAPVRRAPGGWFAVSAVDPPILHAAIDGRYLRGEVTPLIRSLLGGAPAEAAAEQNRESPRAATTTRAVLVGMRLLPPQAAPLSSASITRSV